MTERALVALAHGSRDPRSERTVHEIVRVTERAQAGLQVEAAFLDFNGPSLADVADRLCAQGCREAVVVPLFLTSAYHMRVDVPDAVAQVSAAFPSLHLRLSLSVGTDPALLAVADDRLREALRTSRANEPDGLVLASAGSTDPQANAALSRLARVWGNRRNLPAVAAFASASAPSTGEAVRELQRRGRRRVAVASLFFAPGKLSDRAADLAIEAGAVAVSAPLGAHTGVSRLIRARYSAAELEPAAA